VPGAAELNNPQLLDPGLRIPDEWRRAYRRRPPDQLANDVTKAFDRLWSIEREKDQLRSDLHLATKIANVKIWILTGLVTVQFAVIGWGVEFLIGRLR
jgi:hypothetical protein